ncbi:MAG: D-alanyl-D-alanine carboxypeptidase family protein, partial [Oscillospiraceae bacterium]
ESAVPAAATGDTYTITKMSEIEHEAAETTYTEAASSAEISAEVTQTEVSSEVTTLSAETEAEHIFAEEIQLSTYEVKISAGSSKMPIVTMLPENCSDKSEIWTSSDESVAVVDALGNITGVAEGKCTVTVASADVPEVYAEVAVEVTAPSDGITYINGILVVNKTYSLPSDYAPGVDPEAQAAFDKMQADAAAEGLNIYISSAFRSYEYQSGLYQRYADRDGQAAADRYSARPGHSEHQTGLAFDLNTIDSSFADTAEGKWVAENCYKYGFIIRYPEGKEEITGFIYEPWHIRYLGKDTAKSVYDSGLTLEEYLGIDSVYAE